MNSYVDEVIGKFNDRFGDYYEGYDDFLRTALNETIEKCAEVACDAHKYYHNTTREYEGTERECAWSGYYDACHEIATAIIR